MVLGGALSLSSFRVFNLSTSSRATMGCRIDRRRRLNAGLGAAALAIGIIASAVTIMGGLVAVIRHILAGRAAKKEICSPSCVVVTTVEMQRPPNLLGN